MSERNWRLPSANNILATAYPRSEIETVAPMFNIEHTRKLVLGIGHRASDGAGDEFDWFQKISLQHGENVLDHERSFFAH